MLSIHAQDTCPCKDAKERTTLFRKILLAGVVVSAFAATTMSGATFAPWTSSSSATGNVTAGTLAVSAQDGLDSTIDFTPAGDCANLAPGDNCTATIEVFNTGTLELTFEGTVSSNHGCYTVTAVVPGLGETVDGDGAGQNDALDPSDPPFAWVINLEVSDDNACNGAPTALITASVTASLSSSPHN